MPRRQLQSHQRAVGIADEGVQRVDVERVEQAGDGVGLVGRVDQRVERAVGADVVEGEDAVARGIARAPGADPVVRPRSEEHTSALQSLMRISYAAFCWKNKNT